MAYVTFSNTVGIWFMMFVLADMRKAMPRDVHKKSIIPLKRAVTPEELEYD